jgi:hypothetical protein
LGEESLLVGERRRLRSQAMGRCREGGAWERGIRVGVLVAGWLAGRHGGRGWCCMVLGGGPNPRCSRRPNLGRLVGWGWGVGEVLAKGLRLARG